MCCFDSSHPDVLEFLHIKEVEGNCRNFNISLNLTDEFMRRVESDSKEPWMCEWNGVKMLPRRIQRAVTLTTYSETTCVPVVMTASQLFDEYVQCAWNNGTALEDRIAADGHRRTGSHLLRHGKQNESSPDARAHPIEQSVCYVTLLFSLVFTVIQASNSSTMETSVISEASISRALSTRMVQAWITRDLQRSPRLPPGCLTTT